MEITCSKSTVRTTIPPVRTHEAFIRKLLAAEVRPSGRGSEAVAVCVVAALNLKSILGVKDSIEDPFR
jgi:hypothetical protein